MKNIAPVLLASVSLGACCTNVSTDPRQGGLVGGVCGVSTGAYEQRITDREDRLATLQAAAAGLSRDRDELERQEFELRNEIEEWKSAIDKLDQRFAEVVAEISKTKITNAELELKLREVQKIKDVLADRFDELLAANQPDPDGPRPAIVEGGGDRTVPPSANDEDRRQDQEIEDLIEKYEDGMTDLYDLYGQERT